MMTKPPLLKLVCAAASAVLCLFAQPAWSMTIDASDIINGADHVRDDADGFDIDANGGDFIISSFAGVDGFFGVDGGWVDKEIDISSESIVITFDTPQRIDLLELGRLFELSPNAARWDQVGEMAEITAQGPGATHVGLLTVLSSTAASWTGSSSLPTNLSPGDATGAGLWEITDPFGDFLVSSLTFAPFAEAGIDGKYNSDFALRTLTTTPEPTTAGMLGLGLLGLAVVGRRQRD